MNQKTKIIIGFFISLLFIIYLIYKIDYKNFKNALLSFNLNFLIILSLVWIIGISFRTFRWQLLINQKEEANSSIVFKALSIGYMVNNLLPAKVGELARIEYLKRKQNMGRSFLLGTVFVERLLDIVFVLSFFVLSIFLSDTSKKIFSHNQWMIYILFILIILSVFFMLKPGFIQKFIHIFPEKIYERINTMIDSFSSSIRFLSNIKVLIKIFILSLLIWSLTLVISYFVLLGLEITLPFYAYFFIITVGVLGMVIPSTSGGIGVFHAVSTGSLLVFHVDPEKALAYSVIVHALDFFPSILIGFIVLLVDGKESKKYLL